MNFNFFLKKSCIFHYRFETVCIFFCGNHYFGSYRLHYSYRSYISEELEFRIRNRKAKGATITYLCYFNRHSIESTDQSRQATGGPSSLKTRATLTNEAQFNCWVIRLPVGQVCCYRIIITMAQCILLIYINLVCSTGYYRLSY